MPRIVLGGGYGRAEHGSSAVLVMPLLKMCTCKQALLFVRARAHLSYWTPPEARLMVVLFTVMSQHQVFRMGLEIRAFN